MKALVVGSGGREHAIARSLKESSVVDRLFWTPGNAATGDIAENPGIGAEDLDRLLSFSKAEHIDIVVVGPEAPLVKGIADLLSSNGIPVFGPVAEGAKLEGSKSFAKDIMSEAGIPTARHRVFHAKSDAEAYIRTLDPPFVIKADGLAAGKGVTVCATVREAVLALSDIFDKKVFGEGGSRVVIEDFLEGEEATVLALCDGTTILPLLSSQDHKPVGEGDAGPNTGGMGAISPAPVVSEAVMDRVMDRVLQPLVRQLNARGIIYRGVIYAGLMIDDGQPLVVEFNCRFGDPEAEAVLQLLASDLGELVLGTTKGDLRSCTLSWNGSWACDVVLVSGGYPGSYEKGKVISGLEVEERQGVVVYHAGTRMKDGSVVTDGGRVLNVVGVAPTLDQAVERAYGKVSDIQFEGMHYRKDIGFRGLRRLGMK